MKGVQNLNQLAGKASLARLDHVRGGAYLVALIAAMLALIFRHLSLDVGVDVPQLGATLSASIPLAHLAEAFRDRVKHVVKLARM